MVAESASRSEKMAGDALFMVAVSSIRASRTASPPTIKVRPEAVHYGLTSAVRNLATCVAVNTDASASENQASVKGV